MRGGGRCFSIPPSRLSGPTGSITFTYPILSTMSQGQNSLSVNKKQSLCVSHEAEILNVADAFYLSKIISSLALELSLLLVSLCVPIIPCISIIKIYFMSVSFTKTVLGEEIEFLDFFILRTNP